VAIFSTLAITAAFLVSYSFGQLRFEGYFTQRQLAEDFAASVVRELTQLMNVEDARPATDYEFLVVSGEAYVQRSPLSTLTPNSSVPGLVGHFQVDTAGRFSTPLLPTQVEETGYIGLTENELDKRTQAQEKLRQLLVQRNEPKPVARADKDDELLERNRQIFDELSSSEAPKLQAAYKSELGRVAEYELEPFEDRAAVAVSEPVARAPARIAESKKRKESARSVDQQISPFELTANQRITVFESTINEFRMVQLDGSHLAFHREVLINNERKIQGFVVAQAPFITSLIGNTYRSSSLAQDNDLLVALSGEVVALIPAMGRQSYTSSPGDLAGGDLILAQDLPPPAQQIRMIVTTDALPLGAGFESIVLAALLIGAVIVAGFALLNRLGRQSIALAEQQQDFVSAVSHELKTPLTSIRMYGEILKAGWASEEKKRSYYEYIFNESERLTRLVNNVLHLARISRGSQANVTSSVVSVRELLDAVRTQIDTPVKNAGFTLTYRVPPESLELSVVADPDAFQQIILNLVDNAIKFSANTEQSEIEFGVRVRADRVAFYVRDFGPGIAREQLKKIFTLFYRGESEITRETAGTGIGLALVTQLVSAMGGEIDVLNCEPGAEFSVSCQRRLD
jgi:signal transduction histidine kinase